MNPVVYHKHSFINALHSFHVNFFVSLKIMKLLLFLLFLFWKKNYRKMFLMKIASFNNVLNTTTVETWKHTPLETTEFQIPKLISPRYFTKPSGNLVTTFLLLAFVSSTLQCWWRVNDILCHWINDIMSNLQFRLVPLFWNKVYNSMIRFNFYFL